MELRKVQTFSNMFFVHFHFQNFCIFYYQRVRGEKVNVLLLKPPYCRKCLFSTAAFPLHQIFAMFCLNLFVC